ncbi:MAG: putative alpha/beta hydrolase [Bradymonadia bacterium]|jgi:predicted alpha/beta hydrolase
MSDLPSSDLKPSGLPPSNLPPYTRFEIDNGDGWMLALHRIIDPHALDPNKRPVVLVPGFAMNSFPLRYRPGGDSMARSLARRGHPVWCAELRGQGHSRRYGKARPFSLVDVGVTDLGAAIDAILKRTRGRADGVDVIGCSLGATFMFIQAAWAARPQIARMVNMGGPLRWVDAHPIIRGLAAIKPLWRLRIRGTRRIAQRVLPLAMKVPGALHLYLHPAICDLSEPASLVQTVEDPSPSLNVEIARWIRARDLIHDGRNLTHDLAALRTPLLTVLANADGIVPRGTACSAHDVMLNARRQVVVAGDADTPMAHADLFISRPAEQQVFEPLAAWLAQDV